MTRLQSRGSIPIWVLLWKLFLFVQWQKRRNTPLHPSGTDDAAVWTNALAFISSCFSMRGNRSCRRAHQGNIDRVIWGLGAGGGWHDGGWKKELMARPSSTLEPAETRGRRRKLSPSSQETFIVTCKDAGGVGVHLKVQKRFCRTFWSSTLAHPPCKQS